MHGCRFICVIAAVWAAAASFGAVADAVSETEIPFAQGDAGDSLELRTNAYWLGQSANRAMEAGLYDIALSLAEKALASKALEGNVDARLELVAVDALLALDRREPADARLRELAKSNVVAASRVSLRQAMLSYVAGERAAVEGMLGRVSASELPSGDQAWLEFLRGWVLARGGESNKAEQAYSDARRLAQASSPALDAQIGYLIFREALARGGGDDDTVAKLEEAVAANAGREIGFAYAQQLAVAYAEAGNAAKARDLISRQLASIPSELAERRAQLRLLQTLISGLGAPEARQAFERLLAEDRFRPLMRAALQKAVADATAAGGDTRAFVEQSLERLVQREKGHALLDQALYFRAVFRFLQEDYVGAEADAETLRQRFPASPYGRGMLALQASSAWSRSRFRTAASFLQQMRSEHGDGLDAATISTLVADCYFRAGMQADTAEDFRNAAEAYAKALAEISGDGSGGAVFFQLVLSRLRSGDLEAAVAQLDDPARRAKAGAEMLWRSEWMLVKELRRLGRVSDAYDRVQAALDDEIEEAALRLRLLWLATQLSIEAGAAEDTEALAAAVDAFLVGQDGAFEGDLARRVKASSLLALAESRFALEEPEEAVALLERLRGEFAGSDAALFSYIAQARYFSSVNRTVEAQQLLVSLADSYPQNRLAPMALYEAALNAERRGQDAFLDQANKLLQRIATDYPQSEMVYYARLKQADLLRKLNKFGSAERIYAFLENEYASRPDRYLAQMSLADTLLAQAQEDPAKFEAAISRLELLIDLPDAPLDLRVEAGYKLGQAWRSHGEALRAKQAFWLLYDLMIVEEPRARSLNRKGRYWLARSLFALAEILKEEGELDRANELYGQVVEQGLWGSELARARLAIQAPGAAN